MGLFPGLKDAKVSKNGIFFKPGFSGDVEVVKIEYVKTRRQGDSFIPTLKVITTNHPDTEPVGSERTWFQGGKDADIQLSAIKKFMYAMNGLEIDDPKCKGVDAELDDITTAAVKENLLKGKRVHLETVQTTTKAEEDFTRYDFSPYRAPKN